MTWIVDEYAGVRPIFLDGRWYSFEEAEHSWKQPQVRSPWLVGQTSKQVCYHQFLLAEWAGHQVGGSKCLEHLSVRQSGTFFLFFGGERSLDTSYLCYLIPDTMYQVDHTKTKSAYQVPSIVNQIHDIKYLGASAAVCNVPEQAVKANQPWRKHTSLSTCRTHWARPLGIARAGSGEHLPYTFPSRGSLRQVRTYQALCTP